MAVLNENFIPNFFLLIKDLVVERTYKLVGFTSQLLHFCVFIHVRYGVLLSLILTLL